MSYKIVYKIFVKYAKKKTKKQKLKNPPKQEQEAQHSLRQGETLLQKIN